MNPLYVGIDVSSKSNVVYFMLPDGSKHSNFSVANSHDRFFTAGKKNSFCYDIYSP